MSIKAVDLDIETSLELKVMKCYIVNLLHIAMIQKTASERKNI